MPNYINPYIQGMGYGVGGYYPNSGYGVSAGQQMTPIQSVAPMSYAPATQPNCAVAWVDGEIEARGRQMPSGVTQFYLFDTNSQTIFLKSLNQMGIPNPMMILDYTIRENPQSALSAGQNGMSQGSYNQGGNGSNTGSNTGGYSQAKAPDQDMSRFATKEDFETLRSEIRNMSMNSMAGGNSGEGNGRGGNSNAGGNQNGNSNGQNRGGNRA